MDRLFDLQIFAEETPPADPPKDQTGGGQDGGTPPPDSGGKSFTQEELDRIISDRLKRAEKQWKDAAEEEKKKAAMTETERLKAEKDEAEGKAKAALETANRRIVEAQAQVVAAQAGVKPERLAYVLKLANLADIAVDEKGTADAKAIKLAVDAVLKDLPELAAGGSPRRAGGLDFSGGGSKANVNMNEFIRRAAGR
jgi:membrane protein involved in colicin uptake